MKSFNKPSNSFLLFSLIKKSFSVNPIALKESISKEITSASASGLGFDVTQPTITVDATVSAVAPAQIFTAPGPGAFIYAVKNAIAESHGARGYFMEFTLSNNNTEPVEIFAVNSNVMKSYP